MSSSPSSDHALEWKDVYFYAKKKEILHGVSGHLGKGRLCAIIGASGAGKTTLLNCLAGRSGRVDGAMKMDGKSVKATSRNYRSSIAYVEQHNVMKVR